MVNLEKFFKDFNFRSFNIKRDYPRVSYTYESYTHGYNDEELYYHYNQPEIIEMEIDKRSLENLAGVVSRAEHFLGKEREEQYLRRKHPALADAHSKYQMLLAIYR